MVVEELLRSKQWYNYKVNPFSEGLSSSSGLAAIRNGEFSKLMKNVEKTNSPSVLSDITVCLVCIW